MKIEDLHYDLQSTIIDEKNWNIDQWRKEYPMDYLKAIYILNMADNALLRAEIFNAIYRVTRLHIPSILYKYYSLSDDRDLNKKKLQTLADCKIFMSAIEDFNDPYDSKCFFYDNSKLADIERLKPHHGRMIDDFSSYIRGAALTANGIQSMPMWAHYSNNHAGFCVAYDMRNNIQLKECTFPVQYIEERLDITSLMRNQAKKICTAIDHSIASNQNLIISDDLTIVLLPLLLYNLKLSQWSYENEFRCNTAANAKGMPYIEAMPQEIYIGKNCTKENTEHLLEIGRKLKIPVYKMIFMENSPNYELITQKIE